LTIPQTEREMIKLALSNSKANSKPSICFFHTIFFFFGICKTLLSQVFLRVKSSERLAVNLIKLFCGSRRFFRLEIFAA